MCCLFELLPPLSEKAIVYLDKRKRQVYQPIHSRKEHRYRSSLIKIIIMDKSTFNKTEKNPLSVVILPGAILVLMGLFLLAFNFGWINPSFKSIIISSGVPYDN